MWFCTRITWELLEILWPHPWPTYLPNQKHSGDGEGAGVEKDSRLFKPTRGFNAEEFDDYCFRDRNVEHKKCITKQTEKGQRDPVNY